MTISETCCKASFFFERLAENQKETEETQKKAIQRVTAKINNIADEHV